MQASMISEMPLRMDGYALPQVIPILPAVGKFERLPKWMNCIPLVAQWLWLGLRYGSVSLPSCANPHLTSGGMVGDSKQEYFRQMGNHAISMSAPFIMVEPDRDDCITILSRLQNEGLDFPLVAKPDLGWCGYGIRLIENPQDLERYLIAYPKGQPLMLQRYIAQTGEAGLFYARRPGEPAGRLIGITLRYYPHVIGNGTLTVKELMDNNPRLHRLKNNKLHHVDFDPAYIPEAGEEVRLSLIGSTRVGGLYCDGSMHISPALEKAVDAVARDMKEFYIGRFDVRYENLQQLRQGLFTIMEVNGAGSEAIHAWDPKYSIPQSYRIIFDKQRLLFQIGAANRRKGYKPIGLVKLALLHFHQQNLINHYPLSN